MIYLASPYSHIPGHDREEPAFIREKRYLKVMQAIAILWRQGHHVFSPVILCHEAAKICDLPKGHDFWSNLNHDFINSSTEVWILCIEGWRFSKGIADEIRYCYLTNKHIRYMVFEDMSYTSLRDETGSWSHVIERELSDGKL